MIRLVAVLSVLLNLLTLGLALSLYRSSDPVVARVENSIGNRRVVRASTVRRELADRHGEDVLGDLAGREIVTLAAQESGLKLDVEEFEARWHLWSLEPGVKARLDSGETTEGELRSRLVTLVLLDQISLNEFNPNEREDLLRAYYEVNQRDLEQIKLRHILLDSEKAAHDVAQRLAAGVDFGQLATRFSLDPLTREQGGLLGWKSRGDLSEELSPLLFLMPEGRASKPLSTRHGWHLFLVEDRQVEYAEVRETAKRKWCETRRPDTLAQLRARFKVESPNKKELLELLRPFSDLGSSPDLDKAELK